MHTDIERRITCIHASVLSHWTCSVVSIHYKAWITLRANASQMLDAHSVPLMIRDSATQCLEPVQCWTRSGTINRAHV